jgi:hypothetical protein
MRELEAVGVLFDPFFIYSNNFSLDLGYIPSTAAAVIFFLLYGSVAAHATWLMFRHKGRYMTALVVCGYIYALGLILRIGT